MCHSYSFLTSAAEREQARVSASDMVQSHFIDFNDLSARLQNISADRQEPPRPSSSTSSTTTAYNEGKNHRHHLKEETKSYNTSVNKDDRFSHSISLNRYV